jgi:hypothetical protein
MQNKMLAQNFSKNEFLRQDNVLEKKVTEESSQIRTKM